MRSGGSFYCDHRDSGRDGKRRQGLLAKRRRRCRMVDVVMLFTRWEKGRDQGRKLGDIASREVATGNNAALLWDADP